MGKNNKKDTKDRSEKDKDGSSSGSESEEAEYVVEKICNRRIKNGKVT